jgi:hypothetical protein
MPSFADEFLVEEHLASQISNTVKDLKVQNG